ncbi:MAG: glutamine amidotransferase-related protein [Maricaulaceae bacterium]
MTRILVIDGYDAAGMASLADAGATKAGILYKAMLAEFMPASHIETVDISLKEPPVIDASRYDGVCWTGSNLSFSTGDHVTQRHITVARAFFEKGIPQFGSCWAAQLAAAATDGTVEANPKGREFGISRKIALTEAGKTHPMFKGKPLHFEGFTSHGDIVTNLPQGAQVLAGNNVARVQALALTYGAGEFWAVQYHPEYDFAEIGALTIARKGALIAQGSFRDEAAVMAYVQDMRDFGADKTRIDIAWKYGIEADLSDTALRTIEVKNWLSYFFNI